jgi:hypothetical protein
MSRFADGVNNSLEALRKDTKLWGRQVSQRSIERDLRYMRECRSIPLSYKRSVYDQSSHYTYVEVLDPGLDKRDWTLGLDGEPEFYFDSLQRTIQLADENGTHEDAERLRMLLSELQVLLYQILENDDTALGELSEPNDV